jgi:hypothetical protein
MDGNQVLVSIYRQYDGYPSGLGQEVADFVGGMTVVNGYGKETKGIANGMGCLAAQLIKHLKTGVGNVYIRDTGPESHGEEYVYNLSEKDGRVWLMALGGTVTAFGMPGDSEPEMTTLYYGFASDFLVTEDEAA